MKSVLFILAILTAALRLSAQTNEAARLALVSESDEVSPASDLLTATLSANSKIHLLERNEIKRVYREQALSAVNKDYLKLGQILGADGLLLMGVGKQGTNEVLNVRVVAVKPGVMLTAEQFPWPLKDLTGWSAEFTRRLELFLPKLTVLEKDAIPISIVNLRSSIQSSEAKETERQMKLLTIQRLSKERQLFVLERQQMELLGEEKELKADDSPFWNGSYLLEGILDQNGYSRETITLNARLAPPKGGAPIQFEIKSSRTNLADLINQLAVKVQEALKIRSTVSEWNAADEAQQYFVEAEWAWRWGLNSEAQMAADSAWALGKHDLDCALLRVKTQLALVSENPVPFNSAPGPISIERATRGLQLYYGLSRSSPQFEPKVLSHGTTWNDWNDAHWYQLGISGLETASGVLSAFYFSPGSQVPVRDKLTELRACAREVGDLISESPSAHDNYFTGSQTSDAHDEVGNGWRHLGNIYICKLTWGCLWQETPEDCVARYRELMASPVFGSIHGILWRRRLQSRLYVDQFNQYFTPPRLVAWQEKDRERIPLVWSNFVKELSDSTNVFFQLEAKGINYGDAGDEGKMAEIEAEYSKLALEKKNLHSFEEQKQFLTAKALFDAQAFDQLFTRGFKDYTQSQAAEIQPLLGAYEADVVASLTFDELFTRGFKDHTQSQAAKLQPLLGAYEADAAAGMAVFSAKRLIGGVQENLSAILNPPGPFEPYEPHPHGINMRDPAILEPNFVSAPGFVSNPLVVSKFLPIPLDGLTGSNISHVTFISHHWMEQKLVLDFNYMAFIISYEDDGRVKRMGNLDFRAIAILDPKTERWNVIGCPQSGPSTRNTFYHKTAIWLGDVFTSDDRKIMKYNSTAKKWDTLEISDGGNYALFIVNDHLYAANEISVFEIIDGGKGTRLLASKRRQPPVSALDTEVLDSSTLLEPAAPTLFEGPGHSLRIATAYKIFTWIDNDWREDSAAPPAFVAPTISRDGVLFASEGFFGRSAWFCRLATDTNTVEICVGQKLFPPAAVSFPDLFPPDSSARQPVGPIWKLPPGLCLQNLSAAFRHADFYLLVDHSEAHEIADEQNSDVKVRIVGKDGYNAQLLCFSPDQPAPQVLFLKFDAPGESPPLVGLDPASLRVIPGKPPSWMIFGNDFLFFGLERNRIDPPPPWGWPSGVGAAGKPGVWLMPVSQLETALTAQKQAGIPQDAQPEQNRKDLLDTPGTLGNGPPLYRGIPPGRIGSANAMTNSRTP